jgi:hypothetical protein
MLVTHGAIEAPLCDVVAGRLEMNGAESLVRFLLGQDGM